MNALSCASERHLFIRIKTIQGTNQGSLSSSISGALLFCLVGVCFSGCLMTRDGVQQAEQKKQMSDQFQNIQKTQADSMNQQNEILEQQRKVLGRIESLEAFEANRAKEQAQQKEQALEREKLLKDELLALREELAQVKSAVATLAAGTAAAGAPSSGGEGASPLQAANEAFSTQEWRKAVLLYQKFRDKNPKSKWMPEATYKMGVSFVELGMKEEAGELFKDIVAKYPKSEYHSKAKAALRKLKM